MQHSVLLINFAIKNTLLHHCKESSIYTAYAYEMATLAKKFCSIDGFAQLVYKAVYVTLTQSQAFDVISI